MNDPHDKNDVGDNQLFTSHLSFNQEAEAQRLVELILGSNCRLQVLHGRAGTGKTTLIREHLLPSLAAASGREVFFSICQPDFPQIVRTLDDEEVDIQEAMRRPAVVVVDAFDRFLGLDDSGRRWALKHVFKRLQEEDVHAAIVVVVSDDALSRVFEFRKYEPEIVEAVFSIQEVDVDEALAKIVEADEGAEFSLSPDLVEELRADLQEKDEGVSPDLVKALNHQLRKLHLETGKVVLERQDYQKLGRLTGILRSYLVAWLDRLERTNGLEQRRIAEAILREIVGANVDGRAVDFHEIQRRLDIDEEKCLEVVAELAGEGGVLREIEPRVFTIAPSQLAYGIRQHLEEQARELEGPRRLAREGYKSWERLGVLLPEDRYREIDHDRRRLLLEEEEVQFMLRCSLVYDTSPGLETAGYWRRRVGLPEDAMDILLEHLYHRFEDVRACAATLLDYFDVPEVRDQLHLVALQDESARARAAAVSSLEGLQTDELRGLLLQEARDPRSPYRSTAVQALRIFRDPVTAAALQGLVNDPDVGLELRDEAIRILAALGVTEAVDALVEIGLHDPDAEDRESAVSALGTLESPELNHHLLETLRHPPSARRKTWGEVLSGALRAAGLLAVAGLLTFFALWIHGLLLMLAKRWRFGIAFLAVEGSAIIVSAVLDPDVGLLLWLLSMVVSLAVSGGVLLGGLRDGSLRPGSLQHQLAGTVLVPLGVLSFFLGHGLAHVLVKRWLRGLYLFAMGWGGLAILSLIGAKGVLTLFSPSQTLTNLGPDIGPWFLGLYWTVGWLLYIGSFVYDFGLVAWRWIFFPRRSQVKRRRKAILGSAVTNPAAADRLFEGLQSENRAKAKWCQRILARFSRAIPSEGLVERLKEGDPAELPWVIRCLKKVDSDAAVDSLTGLYQKARPAVRDRIVRVLAGNPSQRSLAALDSLGKQLRWSGKARYHCGLWQFRFKLLPPTAIVLVLVAIPLAVVFVLEGWQAGRHPERGILKWVNAPIQMGAAAYLAGPDGIIDTLGDRSMLARAAAEAFPIESVEGLLSALEKTYGFGSPEWFFIEDDARKIREAVTQHQVSLLRTLGEVATHPEVVGTYPGFPPDESHALNLIAAGLKHIMVEHTEAGSPLAVELRIALLKVYGSRRDEAGLAAVVGVSRVDEPLEWREALTARGKDEQRALLAGLGALGTENAVRALIEFTLYQERGPSRRDEQRPLGQVVTQVELQREALAILGKIGTVEAKEALVRIANDAMPIVKRSAEKQLAMFDLDLAHVELQLDNREFDQVVAAGRRWLDRGELLPPELRVLLGRAHHGLGEYDQAIELLEPMSSLLVGDDDARYALVESFGALALRLLDRGEPAKARDLLVKAVEIDEALGWPQGYLATALVQQTRFREAMPYARAAIELRQDLWIGYQALVDSYGGEGMWREAEEILLNAAAADPALVWPQGYLAIALIQQERFLEAMPYARRAIEVGPDVWIGYQALLDSYGGEGMWREAEEILENAAAVDGALGWPQGYLAMAFVQQERFREAMPYAQRAIEVGPDVWIGYQALLDSYGGEGKWLEAEEFLYPLVESQPDNLLALEYLQRLGYVYHEELAVDKDLAYFEHSHNLWHRLISPEYQTGNVDPNTQANYIESCLTTAHYQEAVRLGKDLLLQEGVEPEIAIPTRLIVYTALVLDEKWEDAGKALDEIEGVLSDGIPAGTWSFRGTAHFVTHQDFPENLRAPLLRALEGQVDTPVAMKEFLKTSRSAIRERKGAG